MSSPRRRQWRLRRAIFGKRLVTEQSGPHGRVVQRVLVEAAVDFDRSLYVSLMVDAARARSC